MATMVETAQCRHAPTPKHSTANGQNGHTPGKCRGICKVGDTVVEQELIYEKLPGDIAERHVLLMDPILATGNSAGRAIQVRYQAAVLSMLTQQNAQPLVPLLVVFRSRCHSLACASLAVLCQQLHQQSTAK